MKKKIYYLLELEKIKKNNNYNKITNDEIKLSEKTTKLKMYLGFEQPMFANMEEESTVKVEVGKTIVKEKTVKIKDYKAIKIEQDINIKEKDKKVIITIMNSNDEKVNNANIFILNLIEE